MILQYSPLSLALGIATVFLLLLAVFAGKRLSLPGVVPIFVFFVAATFWSGIYTIILASVDLTTTLILNALAYPAIVTIPVVCLLFTLWYTERDTTQSRLFIALLFVIPVLSVILVATNSFHHLYYTGFLQFTGARGEIIWCFERGPLFWLAAAYSLVMILCSILLLLLRYRTVGAIFRTQIHLLLFAVLLPLFTYGLYLMDLGPIPGFNVTPLALMISGLALLAATLFFELFSLQPLTHSLLVKTMQDPVIATNRNGAVTLMNPAAESLLGTTEDAAAGRMLTGLKPELGQYLSESRPRDQDLPELTLQTGAGDRIFDVRSVTIRPVSGPVEGTILTFRDITERRNTESALRIANRKLKLLTAIVRHDIKNRLTTLFLYLDLALDAGTIGETRESLGKIRNSADGIQALVEFTRKYENLGAAGSGWQNAGRLLRKAQGLLDTSKIQVIDETEGLEIYADPLVDGVFYNLLDNALRYATGMTRFRMRCVRREETLDLILEDDGAGVPVDEKEKIFSRGYGNNTGLGLYLVREILEITGLSIRETGIPGKGAKFEISIPPGHYRFPEPSSAGKEP